MYSTSENKPVYIVSLKTFKTTYLELIKAY